MCSWWSTRRTCRGRRAYAIDQYVLGGGKAMVFVDPFSEAAAGIPDPENPMRLHNSRLPELFAAWGVELSPGMIVGDRSVGAEGARRHARTSGGGGLHRVARARRRQFQPRTHRHGAARRGQCRDGRLVAPGGRRVHGVHAAHDLVGPRRCCSSACTSSSCPTRRSCSRISPPRAITTPSRRKSPGRWKPPSPTARRRRGGRRGGAEADAGDEGETALSRRPSRGVGRRGQPASRRRYRPAGGSFLGSVGQFPGRQRARSGRRQRRLRDQRDRHLFGLQRFDRSAQPAHVGSAPSWSCRRFSAPPRNAFARPSALLQAQVRETEEQLAELQVGGDGRAGGADSRTNSSPLPPSGNGWFSSRQQLRDVPARPAPGHRAPGRESRISERRPRARSGGSGGRGRRAASRAPAAAGAGGGVLMRSARPEPPRGISA